jgi:hypothetical protein
MAFPFDFNDAAFPGIETVLETVQNQVWWGRHERQVFAPAVISGAIRDVGNTNHTTTIRPGMLLGKITATGLLTIWTPAATDGSQNIYGVLIAPLSAQDAGVDTDRYTYVMVNGDLMDDRILIPGNAEEGLVGDAREFEVLAQTYPRFNFDRNIIRSGNPHHSRVIVYGNTAVDRTVVAAENGSMFIDTGAAGDITFNLPDGRVGMCFTFAATVATHSVIIDAAPVTNTIITPGDVAATAWTLAPGELAEVTCIAADVWQITRLVQLDTTA